MKTLALKLERDGERLVLRAPSVGLWRHAPAPGSLVRPGDAIGELEILGRRHRLVAPAGAGGIACGGAAAEADTATIAVDAGAVLLRLDPHASAAADAAADAAATSSGVIAGQAFTAPSSGRFWRRPSPDAPPLVSEGDTVSSGDAIGLLEVMKTFTRLTYGGPGLPPSAVVVRILPEDGEDVDAGDPILELE